MDKVSQKYKRVLILIASFLKQIYSCNDFNLTFNFDADTWLMTDSFGKCLMYLPFSPVAIPI